MTMQDTTNEPNDDTPDKSPQSIGCCGTPGHSSRRRVLHILGATGVAGIAGCSSGPIRDSETGPDSSPTGETKKDTEPGTDTSTPELRNHATIGVDYGLTSVVDYSTLAFYTRTFEPLTYTTPELGVRPWLASTWDRTGKLTWEFTLRDGVEYHNGDPLTADRVLSMLEWGLTYYRGGLLAVPRWANTTADGVRKLDESTIEMETIVPTVNQPAHLAILTHFGAHPSSSIHRERDYSTLIGTGPYQVEEVKRGQHVKLSAFEDYWGGPPRMDELTIRQFSDQNTLALALKGKEVDVGLELPAAQHTPIENADEFRTETRQAPKIAALKFNLKESPMTDLKFRKALNYATSQQQVVDVTQKGLGIPAKGPLSPVIKFSAHDSLPTYGPDKAKAKTLLEESEYDGKTLDLISNNAAPRSGKLIIQLLQQELGDIGIDIETKEVGINVWPRYKREGDGHLFLGEGTSNAPDEPLSERLASYGDASDHAVNTPRQELQDRISSLVDTARTNADQERTDALRKAQHLIMDEALLVPLYHEQYVVGMRNDVSGIDWHPLSSWSRIEHLTYTK